MKGSETQDRIEWIDIAKGIGILFVIFAHIQSTSQALVNYIYSFHMPLFFFISGYLFSDKKYKTIKDFAKKKARTLLIPYFIFSILSYLYWTFIQIRMGDDIKHPDLFRAFIGIFYSDPNHHFMSYNVALWFLTCLFSTEILFFFVKRKIENKHHLLISLVIFSIIGYLSSLFEPFRLPWGMDVALSAIVFYGIGYLFKNADKTYNLLQKIPKIPVILLSLPIGWILGQMNQEIDMASNYFRNYFLFYFGAFFGIFGWISVSYLIKESFILSYLGKNSLIIFGLHLKVPSDFLIHKILRVNAETINADLYSSIDTIITLLILIPVIWIINRFFPFIIGQGKILADDLTVKEELPAKD